MGATWGGGSESSCWDFAVTAMTVTAVVIVGGVAAVVVARRRG